MARFFTADLHLVHRNIARYEPERTRAAGIAPLDGPADDEIVDGTATVELADGTLVDVDHFPYEGDSREEDRHVDWRPTDHGRVLLHGHVHSSWRTNGRMINVGVDVWDYAPVPEDQVIELAAAVAG
jgi:calcineurin-like phosphoesterase family protein